MAEPSHVLARLRHRVSAIDCYEKADAILVELGDHQARTMVMSNLGTAHRQAGRAEEAETCRRFALALIREFGIDRHSEATALNNLGTVLTDRGKLEEAIAAHANAVVVFGEGRRALRWGRFRSLARRSGGPGGGGSGVRRAARGHDASPR
ncbi:MULTISPECIES: tetratricopeptide repeat protein [Streptomyces]|uniref:Tetratricopeptide repeat protein n=1 Tax=Streptomyces viridochromogenes TaxID=1938 RepID=A0A0L8LD18_STRVR|nr:MULTISPECIES: tetratricopeptide repeat protein [Streptomyces]KOG36123.1 hypothetical protein ADK34_02810 [Streptomyces viridochromogenes]